MTKTIQKNMHRGRTLRIAFGILIVALLFVSCAWAAQPSGTEIYNGKKVAANEILVKFRSPVTQDMIVNAQIGENVEKAEHVGSAGVLRFHSKNKNVTTLIRDLSARADVEYAEPNYIVHALATPNDPYYGDLYGLNIISTPLAWDISQGSTANVVAVIDTGIDYTHPDLAANVWSAPTAYTVTIDGTPITCPAGSHGFNAIYNTCDPMDDNSHGTHCSGTIGAVGNNGIGVVGVNWNTRIIGAKFLDSNGNGYTSDAINAIDFLIQTKNKFPASANVRVLSNSWGGGGYSQALLDEINLANTKDMLFVAAAGNAGSNNDVTPFYPASYSAPSVVAVAATDNTDSLAYFSNYGLNSVDLGAPGVNILSTIPYGGYGYKSGTSMATPHVSGAALLILSKCTLDTGQLKTNILNNVDPVPSLSGITVTGGRLNVNKAIRACSGIKTPTITTLSASPDSSTFGDPVTFTATVTPSGATGTVTFYDSGSPLGTATLSGGQATLVTSTLSGGAHSITATYSGDLSFDGSTSSALPYTVSKTTSKTSLISSVNPSTFGQLVTFTATVSPVVTTSGPAPVTGTVTFYDGDSQLGSPVTLSSGTASFSTSSLSVGSHLIKATYGGDSNIIGSTSLLTQAVDSVPASDFSLSASPSSQSVIRGSGATYTVTVTRVPGFTDSVTLMLSGLPSGASGTFSPNPATGTSSTLSITTASTTPPGSYPLTITGTSGSFVHTTQVTLIVNTACASTYCLSVLSSPSGAAIFVDGKNTGHVTPFTISDVAAGNHEVYVLKDCYVKSDRKNVIVIKGDIVPVDFTLQSMGACVPEFPSGSLPVIIIIVFLGAVLIIQRTREN